MTAKKKNEEAQQTNTEFVLSNELFQKKEFQVPGICFDEEQGTISYEDSVLGVGETAVDYIRSKYSKDATKTDFFCNAEGIYLTKMSNNELIAPSEFDSVSPYILALSADCVPMSEGRNKLVLSGLMYFERPDHTLDFGGAVDYNGVLWKIDILDDASPNNKNKRPGCLPLRTEVLLGVPHNAKMDDPEALRACRGVLLKLGMKIQVIDQPSDRVKQAVLSHLAKFSKFPMMVKVAEKVAKQKSVKSFAKKNTATVAVSAEVSKDKVAKLFKFNPEDW